MPAVTEDDRELGKLLDGIHGEKLSDPQRRLIDAFIGSHPNYPGGYAIRAMYTCGDEKPRLPQLESDLTQATAHPSGMSATMVDNPASLRAKIAFANGDYRVALDLLSSAASVDWSSAPQVFNIAGTKPEEEGGGFIWLTPRHRNLPSRHIYLENSGTRPHSGQRRHGPPMPLVSRHTRKRQHSSQQL
jgi:hypothetical protein